MILAFGLKYCREPKTLLDIFGDKKHKEKNKNKPPYFIFKRREKNVFKSNAKNRISRKRFRIYVVFKWEPY